MTSLRDLFLACAIVALFTLLGRQIQEPTPVVVWDAVQYYKMADQFAVGRAPYAESPYVFRIAIPWVVSKISPGDPTRGFFTINLVSAFAIAVLLTYWLRAWLPAIAVWIPAAMVALVAAAWHGPARYIYYNPGYVDPPFIALLLVGLLLIKSIADRYSAGKVVLLIVVSTVGALVRETMLLVPLSFLLVNGPVKTRVLGQRPRRSIPRWTLVAPLAACLCAVAFTHAVVTVDLTERASMVQAAFQWLRKPPDAYAMGWFTTFGPVLSIIAFDWRRAVGLLSEHEWLAAFFFACAALALLGGSDTERFALWSLPVVYLLLARAIEHHAPTFRNAYLMTALVVTQAVSARLFWGIPDPHGEQVVALTANSGWGDRIYGVLNRLIVIDSFHFNLWSSFGSRPFRVLRLGLYVLVTAGLVWAMRLNDREIALGTLGGTRHRAEHGEVVE